MERVFKAIARVGLSLLNGALSLAGLYGRSGASPRLSRTYTGGTSMNLGADKS